MELIMSKYTAKRAADTCGQSEVVVVAETGYSGGLDE
jgi:hypothetical protein